MKLTYHKPNLPTDWALSRGLSHRAAPCRCSTTSDRDHEGRLLSATNLELGITCWIGAQIEEEGSVIRPHFQRSGLHAARRQGQSDPYHPHAIPQYPLRDFEF